MVEYDFEIDTYKVSITAEVENEYHVTIDGVFAGVIFPEFIDEPPFLIWKTTDLIQEDLVQKIGAAIEDEDE